MATVRNKFDALQRTFEIYSPNNEYKNFVTTDMNAAAAAAAGRIRTKPRAKVKETKKAQRELINKYQKV